MSKSDRRNWGTTFSALRKWFHGAPHGGTGLRLETLECRNVPAVTAIFDSISGVLTVFGDADDDNIVIVENGGVEVVGVTIIGGPVAAGAVNGIEVFGNEGNDTIDLRGVSAATGFTGLTFVDIFGGDGNDLVHGATNVPLGEQFIEGGLGNDTLYGGDGDDYIVGGFFSNDDDMTDFFGNDYIDGGPGNDIIYGDDESIPASLPAGGGNDTIIGGPGNDYLNGGPGNDVYRFANGWGLDVIVDESGIDTVDFSDVTINLTFSSNRFDGPVNRANNVEFDTDQIERYIGGRGDDTFSFGPGANFGNGSGVLDGGPGTNYLDYSMFGPGAVVNFADPFGTATGVSRIVNIQQAINAQVTGTPPPATSSMLHLQSNDAPLFESQYSSGGDANVASRDSATNVSLEDSHDSHEGHQAAGGGSMHGAADEGVPESETLSPAFSDPAVVEEKNGENV